MVITSQVENTVQEKKDQPGIKCHSSFLGFPQGGVGGYHHVAEDLGIQLTERPLVHGK
jgi:hypothetical protein